MKLIIILATIYLIVSFVMNMYALGNGGFELYVESLEVNRINRTWKKDLTAIAVTLAILPLLTLYNILRGK